MKFIPYISVDDKNRLLLIACLNNNIGIATLLI